MKHKDKINQPIGIFTLLVQDKNGKIIEKYSEKNLIMDNAKITMAKLVGGVTPFKPINRFILGTRGHKDDNVLTNKQVGEDGFVSERTELFSQSENELYYTIDFNPNSDTLDKDDDGNTIGYFNGDDSNTQSGNTVKRTVEGSEVTYTIVIPLDNANHPDSDKLAAYTECSLNCDNIIFSMKTFPVRVKEDSVQYTITYKIIF